MTLDRYGMGFLRQMMDKPPRLAHQLLARLFIPVAFWAYK